MDIPEGESKKRPGAEGSGEGNNPPVPKKARLGQDGQKEFANLPTLARADVPSPLCWTASLPLPASSKKAGGKCNLVIAVGQKLFLANEGSCDLEFSAGFVIAGYWKGTWQKSATEERESDVCFKLENADDLVILDGKVQTLAQVIASKRATSPLEIKVMYHELVEKPKAEDTTFFTLQPKENCKVVFRPESVPMKEENKSEAGHVVLPYTSVAGCIPTACWNNLATQIVWSVKWSARGLCPLRPNVCLKGACQIKPGHAICFQQQDA